MAAKKKQPTGIGRRIKHLMTAKWGDRGAQARLAEATGIQTPALSKYVNGHQVPETATLMKIAAALGVSLADLEGVGPKVSDRGSFSIPNLGWVPAGRLADAATATETTRFHEMFGGDGVFTLDVRGDSMTGAGIFNHDVLVVKPAEHADPGDIVVAEVNGEKTVKQLNLLGGKLALFAFNEEFPPIVLTEGDDVRICGVVIGGAWVKKKRRMPPKPPYKGKK